MIYFVGYVISVFFFAYVVAKATEEPTLGACMVIWPVTIPALLFMRFCEWAADEW